MGLQHYDTDYDLLGPAIQPVLNSPHNPLS